MNFVRKFAIIDPLTCQSTNCFSLKRIEAFRDSNKVSSNFHTDALSRRAEARVRSSSLYLNGDRQRSRESWPRRAFELLRFRAPFSSRHLRHSFSPCEQMLPRGRKAESNRSCLSLSLSARIVDTSNFVSLEATMLLRLNSRACNSLV